MDFISRSLLFTLILITVNDSYSFLRPYDVNTRLLRRLRQTLRFSRKPAIWRITPVRPPKMKAPLPAASQLDTQFSLPDSEIEMSDQETSSTDHDHHHGRVLIKVFRGPEDEHHFAPHGYFVKHPEDD